VLRDTCYSNESLASQESRGYSLRAKGGVWVIGFCSRMTRASSKAKRVSALYDTMLCCTLFVSQSGYWPGS